MRFSDTAFMRIVTVLIMRLFAMLGLLLQNCR